MRWHTMGCQRDEPRCFAAAVVETIDRETRRLERIVNLLDGAGYEGGGVALQGRLFDIERF